jgi:hypothetical protein
MPSGAGGSATGNASLQADPSVGLRASSGAEEKNCRESGRLELIIPIAVALNRQLSHGKRSHRVKSWNCLLLLSVGRCQFSVSSPGRKISSSSPWLDQAPATRAPAPDTGTEVRACVKIGKVTTNGAVPGCGRKGELPAFAVGPMCDAPHGLYFLVNREW